VVDAQHALIVAQQVMLAATTIPVEHPFATLKYHVFGHPRFLLRGLRGAHTEIGLAAIAYNLKRMVNILGGLRMTQQLRQPDTKPSPKQERSRPGAFYDFEALVP
jgi:hypothetical protein